MCFVCYHIDTTLDAGVWRWTTYHLHYHPHQYLRYPQCLYLPTFGQFQWRHLWLFSYKLRSECCWSCRDTVHYRSTISDISFHGGRVSRSVGNWTCAKLTCPSCLDMHERVGVLPGQHVRSCLVKRGGSARRCVSFGVAPARRRVWSLVWRQQACLSVSVESAHGQRLIPFVNAADQWRVAASRKCWYQHRRVTIIGGQSRSENRENLAGNESL